MGALLSKVSKPKAKPPRIVIHGRGGVGKTTFAASAPGALFLPAEDGLGTLQVDALEKPGTFNDVLTAVGELLTEKHDFKTLVIDTIDHIEPLIWNQVCNERSDGKKSYETIEDFGYGKGYNFADPLWIRLFRGLDRLRAERGMTTIVLCHNELKTINDPMIGAYDAMQPKLHKRANALLYEWADVVGFLDIEKAAVEKEGARGKKTEIAQSLGGRLLYLEPMGGFEAKNRYDLPTRMQIPKEGGYSVLRNAIVTAITKAAAPPEPTAPEAPADDTNNNEEEAA